MDAGIFLDMLLERNITFFTGVPDSQLRGLCDSLMARFGTDAAHHIIAQNEGGSVGLAAGHHLATGKTPCVYMQNSGLGNAVNPVASLTNGAVYGIPTLFVVGWRGRPGQKDEPQHVFQGQITLELLRVLGLDYEVIGPGTGQDAVAAALERFSAGFGQGKSAAFVVEKGGFTCEEKYPYQNPCPLVREEALEQIARHAEKDAVVSSTGKISRELFEIRERAGVGHGHDFLVVGSMGHAAMIALGIALEKPKRRVWCIDGDGALLMHMGALAVIGSQKPPNFLHVVLNNGAHETVGGMPTAAFSQDIPAHALAAGYTRAERASTAQELQAALDRLTAGPGPALLEVRVNLDSRADLGRPTTTPMQNKKDLMDFLSGES